MKYLVKLYKPPINARNSRLVDETLITASPIGSVLMRDWTFPRALIKISVLASILIHTNILVRTKVWTNYRMQSHSFASNQITACMHQHMNKSGPAFWGKDKIWGRPWCRPWGRPWCGGGQFSKTEKKGNFKNF